MLPTKLVLISKFFCDRLFLVLGSWRSQSQMELSILFGMLIGKN
ncbi:MAG: hypothetical protein WBM86_13185 [Waterburya sp.]